MSDLALYFSKVQIPKLTTVGFGNLFDFITHFPYKLNVVEPLLGYPKETKTYLWQGKLVKIEFRKSAKRYMVLDFVGTQDIRTYCFNSSPYLLKILKEGGQYQLLLSYKNNLWNLEKVAIFVGNVNSENLILGKAVLKNYLIPKYEKMGFFTSNYFLSLHQKLPVKAYQLDLSGLAPQNQFFPNIIDLSKIHKPVSEAEFSSGLHSWLAFKVFLRLSLIKYIDLSKIQKFGKKSVLNLEFLKSVTSKLPFDLSLTQKQAIWEILQEITENKDF